MQQTCRLVQALEEHSSNNAWKIGETQQNRYPRHLFGTLRLGPGCRELMLESGKDVEESVLGSICEVPWNLA